MYFPREFFFSSSGENVSVSQLEGYHNLQHSRVIVLLLLVGNCKDGTRSSKQGQGQMIINHRLSSSPQQRALFPLPQESCRNGEKRYLPPLRLRYKSFIFWRCRLFIVAFSFFRVECNFPHLCTTTSITSSSPFEGRTGGKESLLRGLSRLSSSSPATCWMEPSQLVEEESEEGEDAEESSKEMRNRLWFFPQKSVCFFQQFKID